VNAPEPAAAVADVDDERRFGGLRRLYGAEGYQRLRALRVAVVGLGGVGSWAVEALARSGVAELVLIDFDHVAESNINRQIQAVGATLGQSKAVALAERIADIHPGCAVRIVDAFVEPDNWPAMLPGDVDGVIDACDQVSAKTALCDWARRQPRIAFVTCGAAGGKRQAHRIDIADLSATTHDPLLASLRHRLRRHHGAARQGRMAVRAVYSPESVARPATDGEGACEVPASTDGTLNCAGYGSVVTVTASFGLAAAGDLIEQSLKRA